jgi:hypothetical protein
MSFIVTVKTCNQSYCYFAIAASSGEVFDDVYDLFGACGVSVRSLEKSV